MEEGEAAGGRVGGECCQLADLVPWWVVAKREPVLFADGDYWRCKHCKQWWLRLRSGGVAKVSKSKVVFREPATDWRRV